MLYQHNINTPYKQLHEFIYTTVTIVMKEWALFRLIKQEAYAHTSVFIIQVGMLQDFYGGF